jgi:hypothetical protein
VKIEIDLDEVIGDMEGPGLREAVIASAGARLASSIEREMKAQVKEEIRASISRAVEEIVGPDLKTLLNTAFGETDDWGNPKPNSNPKTLMEIVLGKCTSFLTEEVNQYGAKPDYHEKTRMPRFAFFAQKMTEEAFKGEVSRFVEEAKKNMKERFNSQLAQVFTKAFKEIVNV